MGAGEVLKSYLVSLGFDTDMGSYQKFDRTLKDATGKIEGHVSSMSMNYIKGSAVVASALASIGFATIGLMNKLASADMEYQKFGMSMFMGKEAAKQMMIATDALGASIDDIAWNPELRSQYYTLTKQMRSMEQPKDAGSQLKYIRSIRFEFDRLKVEATYGLQWIGYYLFKHLAGPIKELRDGMSKMNDWIQARMPEWAEKAASFITSIFNIGKAVWRTISQIFDGLKEMWDMLPGWAKGIAVLLAVAFAPISPAIKIIAGLLLLLDDFYGYIDGRKSSKMLAPIWDILIMAVDTITRGIVTAMVLIDELYSKMTGGGKSWGEIFKSITGAWNGIEGTVNVVNKPAEKGNSPFFSNVKSGVESYQDFKDKQKSGLYASQGSSTSTTKSETRVDVGGINVHINQPNATPKEIHGAIVQGVKDSQGRATARNTREFKGVN